MGNGGPEIIFVYNADSFPGAQLFDFLHRLAAPQTYRCNLCKITHGTFTKKAEWKEFVTSLPYRPVFLYKDHFRRQYPDFATAILPAIFLRAEGGTPIVLVSAGDVNKQHNVEELMRLLESRLR